MGSAGLDGAEVDLVENTAPISLGHLLALRDRERFGSECGDGSTVGDGFTGVTKPEGSSDSSLSPGGTAT